MVLFISLIGCQQEQGETEELDVKKEKQEPISVSSEKYITFTTDDEMVEFTLVNNDKFSKEKINEIKRETLHAYKEILNLTKSHLEKKKEILIQMHKGEGNSMYKGGGAIELYIQGNNPYPLVHELTHALLDYDKYKASYLTLDGLAVNLEEQITGQISYPRKPANYSLEQLMYYLHQNDLYIPLKLLADPEVGNDIQNLYEADTTRWLLYVEAYSFTKYLIEKHGIDLYMKIYNSNQLEKDIQEMYGESLESLESDWLEYLESKHKDLDIKLPNPDFKKNLYKDIKALLDKYSYK